MKRKIIIFLAASFLLYLPAKAQVRTEINVTERSNSSDDERDRDKNHGTDWSFGFGIGSTKMYGDLRKSNPQPAYIGHLEKNVTPSIMWGETIMVGDLSSREVAGAHWRSFNHYTSIDEHVNVELGTLFTIFNRDYNDNPVLRIFGGIYGGVGIGLINNNIKKIVNVTTDGIPGNTGSANPILMKNTTAFFIPITFGYTLHVPRFWFMKNGFMANVNFQYEDCQSDYIDGYSPTLGTNKKNDVFTVMSASLKFYLTHHRAKVTN